MIVGMSVETFTLLHVVISLIAIAAGLVVVIGWMAGRRFSGWTNAFVITTVLTTLTGFMFPITKFTPAIGVGILSAVVLIVAMSSLYVFRLSGVWRLIFLTASITAFYLNVFVAVVQAFQKLEALRRLAPTQSELPFVVVQAAVLLTFMVVGYLSTQRYQSHPGPRTAVAP